jgi:L-asparaginase II
MQTFPIIAEYVRSGFVEGRHYGSLVAVDADGAVTIAVGAPEEPMLPRSANKPLLAVGMLGAGLDLDGPLLALAAASHGGQPFHLDGVRHILAGAGLTEAALRTPPDYPLDEQAQRDWLRLGGRPRPIAMNCSGQHAAMLATCVASGWPTQTYCDGDHPLQVQLRLAMGMLTGEPTDVVGIDGCGAPLFAASLLGMAQAFRRLVLAAPGTPERRVADAMRAHPEFVGGTQRDVTCLMAGVPGLLAKEGAEGVFAAALADGRAVALKVDDGAQRARLPVMVAALRRLGLDAPVLDRFATTPIMGGGARVGDVRAVGI